MENEDSRFALFPEPNACVMGCENKKQAEKVVFSEPYDCMPNFYINNGFKKGNCDCLPKPKPPQNPCCNFNFSRILPFLTQILGKNSNFSSILQGLSNFPCGANFDFSKILQTVLANKNLFNLSSFFGGNKKNQEKKVESSTDFPIKDYVRVE
ncbi:MAG: hypothetical protein MJ152_04175 [Clostridia bacterium]|nr:hypothetical protein [Clostridia bacterium]